MSAVRVRLDGYNWLAECAHHDDATWCGDWVSAMEAAWGHIAMWHTRPSAPCEHEWTSRSWLNAEVRRCLDCGIELPLGNDDAEEIR